MTLAPLLNLVFLGVTTQLTIPHTAYRFEGVGVSDPYMKYWIGN
jgi:hypothetical protein